MAMSGMECTQAECAWWLENKSACAMTALASGLDCAIDEIRYAASLIQEIKNR